MPRAASCCFAQAPLIGRSDQALAVAPPRPRAQPRARLCWLCERLLESYGSERRPHVREYIATAMRLGELMNTCQTAEELKNTLQPKAKADGAE